MSMFQSSLLIENMTDSILSRSFSENSKKNFFKNYDRQTLFMKYFLVVVPIYYIIIINKKKSNFLNNINL